MTFVQSGPVEDHSWDTGGLIFYDVFSLKVLTENSIYKDMFALSDQQY